MRALPSMLARHPPPLVVEVRDARLALTSINPRFEELLQRAPSAGEHVHVNGSVQPGWAARRLIVYTKADLIDESLRAPLLQAVRENTVGNSVMIVDTRLPRDVRRIYDWVIQRASILARAAANPTGGRSQKAGKLTGAARHSPTPETGVRLLVVGMPNVGKSSLLNRLRFVGTGKGSAASTHPHPGHTRKVTGTVRITPALPSLGVLEASGPVDMKRLVAEHAKQPPAVYVYDTPGIMVPYLGTGVRDGPERALKLAVIGCMKQAQFDSDELVDYLLFRMNQKYMAQVANGDMTPPPYTTLMSEPKVTDNCIEFLHNVAVRAPGSRQHKAMRVALLWAVAIAVLFTTLAQAEMNRLPASAERMRAIHRRRLLASSFSFADLPAVTDDFDETGPAGGAFSSASSGSLPRPLPTSDFGGPTGNAGFSTADSRSTYSEADPIPTSSSTYAAAASRTSSAQPTSSYTEVDDEPTSTSSYDDEPTSSASEPTVGSTIVTAVRSRSVTVLVTKTNVNGGDTVVTVSSQVNSPLPTGLAASTGVGDNSDDAGGNKNTSVIVGTSVAGGVVFLVIVAFVVYKFFGKRIKRMFKNEEIKWPELHHDTAIAPTAPLPARRTGGAGFDMGDENSDDEDDINDTPLMRETMLKPAASFNSGIMPGSLASFPATTDPYGLTAIASTSSLLDGTPADGEDNNHSNAHVKRMGSQNMSR
ncbi:Mitochondrial GTPase 1 [Malassezia cuniculi]|uniref:Mitochondrial GTPase 1 n=1 Tax=Malassezia cuniculi TaxID=948313 RepID=A0AAF0EYB7_9BASI|nr:Mitochondrial GTPase 1 [Malassezia cuniculi]